MSDPVIQDDDLLALNVLEEAGGEIPDGRAAVARIVKNRMARKFFSDGTVLGTVLAKDQFSWAWFGFQEKVTGNINPVKHVKEYVRMCHTATEALALASDYLAKAKKSSPNTLAICSNTARDVMAGKYRGLLYDKLTDDAVSYLNPAILVKLPTWATTDKLVCIIGHHWFYRA